MEVRDIIMAIGFLIIFFYQRHKIGALETEIKSQKGILESADTFFKIFDLEKLRDYGKILTEKTRAEAGLEIIKIKEDLEQKIKKQHDATKFLSGEFIILIKAFFDAFLLLPEKSRNQLINGMDEGTIKVAIKKIHEEAQKEKRGILSEFLDNPKSEGEGKR